MNETKDQMCWMKESSTSDEMYGKYVNTIVQWPAKYVSFGPSSLLETEGVLKVPGSPIYHNPNPNPNDTECILQLGCR